LLDNRVPLVAERGLLLGSLSSDGLFLTFPMGLGAVGMWLGYLPWTRFDRHFLSLEISSQNLSHAAESLSEQYEQERSPRELGPAVIAWAALFLLFWRALTWLAATAWCGSRSAMRLSS